MDFLGQEARPFGMAKKVVSRFKKPKGLPNLKGWRKYRNLTAEALAERAGLTAGYISQLENGGSGYSQEVLETLAEALQVPKPGDLINVDPSKEGAIWSLWENATQAERAQILAVSGAIVKKAAGGS